MTFAEELRHLAAAIQADDDKPWGGLTMTRVVVTEQLEKAADALEAAYRLADSMEHPVAHPGGNKACKVCRALIAWREASR